jgi:hypothetical protein
VITAFVIAAIPRKNIVVRFVLEILKSFVGIRCNGNWDALRKVGFYFCQVVNVFYPKPVFDGVLYGMLFQVGSRFCATIFVVRKIRKRHVARRFQEIKRAGNVGAAVTIFLTYVLVNIRWTKGGVGFR